MKKLDRREPPRRSGRVRGALPGAHGDFTPTVGELTPNGYRLELACCCGVTFERWVTARDAMDDLARERLRAERNRPHNVGQAALC
jgi:hypothetical protein